MSKMGLTNERVQWTASMIAGAFVAWQRKQRMSNARWQTTSRMGWNNHLKRYEMAELIWRAKTAFLNLKIILLHENAGQSMPREESSWK
jgi:uncharacterized protein (DUF927 family)